MKRIAWLLPLFMTSCGVQHHFSSREEARQDTSFVYELPFPGNQAHLLVQGYNSWFSHRGRLGLDFKMKQGSLVTAAREGVVVRVEQGFTKGGINKRYLRRANMVIIRHSDGSQAYYGHLRHNGVLVSVGDSIRQGQAIAHSGSTGYSAFPHLHFIVWGPTPSGARMQLPTRFHTNKGILYLRPGRRYRNR